MDWYENIPGDEMPPQWMWLFPDELEVHFEAVKERRGSSHGDSDAEPDTIVPLEQNEDPRVRAIKAR